MNKSIIDIIKRAEELLGSTEVCKEQLLKTEALREKIEQNQITVSVIGQFKRGKSTLVNAILGEKILPTGIVPVTSVVTRIKHGESAVDVYFDNGVVESINFDELPKYINEQENPGNKYGVSSVTIHSQSEFLADGMTFVDTPGVGSVHKHNSDAAYAFVKESDAVIFTISVDSPINEIEIEFLKNAKAYAAKFYFAVNKIDYIDEEELEVYMDYCKKLLCSLMEVEDVTLLPVSAKKNIGIEELKDRIAADCKASVLEILQDSAAMKLDDNVKVAMSRLNLYWNALRLPVKKQAELFEQMKEYLDSLIEEARAYADTVDADNMKYFEVSNTLDIKLNDIKKNLTNKVSDIFGMEYHYELEELNIGEKYRFDSSEDNANELKDKFIKEVKGLCEDLDNTLNAILLYQEKNTIIIARKVNELNKLNHELRKIREML